MKDTALVIPTYNRRSTLLLALSRVFESLPADHHVVVVDSGSSDGTADAVKKDFPQAHLLEGNSSMWWAAAINRGIEKARQLGCSYSLTENDDNVATSGL